MRVYTNEQIVFIKTMKDQTNQTWEQIIEAYEAEYDCSITYNAIRNCYRRNIDADFQIASTDKLMVERRRLQTNNQRLNKEKNIVLDQKIEMTDFVDTLMETISGIDFKIHEAVEWEHSEHITSRTAVAVLSDLHLGVNVSAGEVGGANSFNPAIAARRLGLLTDTIAHYKPEHREETDLVLILNGDLNAGIIHDSKNIDLMTTQTSMLYSYLTQIISYLQRYYSKITVHSLPGNHDRFMHKPNKQKQTEEKYDCFQTVVMFCLKNHFEATTSNVSVKIYEAPHALIEVQGHYFLATHGDSVISAGNVSKSLNMNKIIDQVNAFNVNLMKNQGKTLAGVILGHYHTSFRYITDDGVNIIGNGCLSGLDPFASSLGIFSSAPAQTIFESTPSHAVGDTRIVQVKGADRDSDYEQIVSPFKKSDLFQ